MSVSPAPALMVAAAAQADNVKALRLGGIEAGGTSFAVSLSITGDPTAVSSQVSIPTTTPAATFEAVAAQLLQWGGVDALGIACFGPLDLDPASETYGYITTTPKKGWQNVDVVGGLRKALASAIAAAAADTSAAAAAATTVAEAEAAAAALPITITTDVNAAAAAERFYGEHGSNVKNVAYVTVGTGIGVGFWINGGPVAGAPHPEGGHVLVRPHPDDVKEGVRGNCPYHGDCLEGLANAGAVASKAGVPPSALPSLPATHAAWAREGYYLGQLCAQITLYTAPHVIVLGGGVLKHEPLFPLARQEMLKALNGYVSAPRVVEGVDTYIVPSRFNGEDSGTTAGAVGALRLALGAWELKQEQNKEQA